MSDKVFMDVYDAVEVDLPTGETVRCKPLKLSEAARFLRLLESAGSGDTEAMAKLDPSTRQNLARSCLGIRAPARDRSSRRETHRSQRLPERGQVHR